MNGISYPFGKLSALTGGYLRPLVQQYLAAQDSQERDDLLVRLGIHAELIPLDTQFQGLSINQRELLISYVQLVYSVSLEDS